MAMLGLHVLKRSVRSLGMHSWRPWLDPVPDPETCELADTHDVSGQSACNNSDHWQSKEGKQWMSQVKVAFEWKPRLSGPEDETSSGLIDCVSTGR